MAIFPIAHIQQGCGSDTIDSNSISDGAALREALELRWQTTHPAGTSLALLHLKLRNLKELAHLFGEDTAQLLFDMIVCRVRALIPSSAFLAQVETDTLAIILEGSPAQDAESYSWALCQNLNGALHIGDMALVVHVSVGVAADTAQIRTSAVLHRQASIALSHGESINAQVSIFKVDDQKACVSRLKLLGSLCGAAGRNELRLYCQPKIAVSTGALAGAEVLVRWAHPTLGLLMPAQFIPLAEQSGIIGQITSWVVQATLGFLREWQSHGNVQKLAINLSAHDVRHPATALRIGNAIEAWGIRPDLLQFELTESALIDDPSAALTSLARLKSYGVDLLVDDFGTGYAGLSYLQKFPIDGIKIDQSFVAPMLTDANSAAIVRSTVELGHALHHVVIAEGVESDAVLLQLSSFNCDYAQGYLFGVPIPIEQLPGWLRHETSLLSAD